MFETNVMNNVGLTRHYIREMIERDTGKIIFMSSESAVLPAQEMAHYSAPKTM
ncbi:TPA: SDR family oxidoreductase [Bacillus cereus]|nr:SDR family oxidoreductase [Bacillus cereus]